MSNYNQALRVLRRLRKEGCEALFAGGCVRDRLLGRAASDYDVVTDAVPDQVAALFRRTLKIGASFGVVMVLLDGRQVEVATFRTEGGYQDGRRPGHVTFTSAQEDAFRRDFTVNGMFYDPIDKKVYDYVGGQVDLQDGVLRTIGRPDERFSEDYLRLLRAVRFAVKLDFVIEPKTWQAMRKHAAKIKGISVERVAVELEEILTHPNRCRGLELLSASGIGSVLFPEFAEQDQRAALNVMKHLPGAVDFGLAMAAFCVGLSTENALRLCRRLKLSNALCTHVRFLLAHRGCLCRTEMTLSELKLLMQEPYFEDLITLQRAVLKAKGKPLRPLTEIRKRAQTLDPAAVHPKPLLNGHELIALGAVPGPMVGRLAKELYIAQLEDQVKTSAQAKKWVLEWLDKHKSSRR